MKITPEERQLLIGFAGYAAAAFGLPKLGSEKTMTYLVDRFIKSFDEEAEELRALLQAEARQRG